MPHRQAEGHGGRTNAARVVDARTEDAVPAFPNAALLRGNTAEHAIPDFHDVDPLSRMEPAVEIRVRDLDGNHAGRLRGHVDEHDRRPEIGIDDIGQLFFRHLQATLRRTDVQAAEHVAADAQIHRVPAFVDDRGLDYVGREQWRGRRLADPGGDQGEQHEKADVMFHRHPLAAIRSQSADRGRRNTRFKPPEQARKPRFAARSGAERADDPG
ncbi:MAG: hypothetical protein J0H86_02405 [Xanthomonadaceae bacterium]|nr:hypothetical protein [Xanthomonadaceae bacterium]